MGIIDIETAMQMLYDQALRAPYNPSRWTTSKTFVPDFTTQEKKFIPDPVLDTKRTFVKDPNIN
jgi:hypothetical protein